MASMSPPPVQGDTTRPQISSRFCGCRVDRARRPACSVLGFCHRDPVAAEVACRSWGCQRHGHCRQPRRIEKEAVNDHPGTGRRLSPSSRRSRYASSPRWSRQPRSPLESVRPRPGPVRRPIPRSTYGTRDSGGRTHDMNTALWRSGAAQHGECRDTTNSLEQIRSPTPRCQDMSTTQATAGLASRWSDGRASKPPSTLHPVPAGSEGFHFAKWLNLLLFTCEQDPKGAGAYRWRRRNRSAALLTPRADGPMTTLPSRGTDPQSRSAADSGIGASAWALASK